MNCLQNHDFSAFSKHINSSKNTICGRHVLFIFLKIVAHSQLKVRTKFVKYSQS
jgi:predicted class III extradiol MEMO1 family dioxygenase